MPYWTFCWRCNADGSYSDVEAIRNCPKCAATGKDWRDDKETEYMKSQEQTGRVFRYEKNWPTSNYFGETLPG